MLEKNNIPIIHLDLKGREHMSPDFCTDGFIIECKKVTKPPNIQGALYSVAGKRLFLERKGIKKRWIFIIDSPDYTSQMITFGKVCFDYVLPHEYINLLPNIVLHKTPYNLIWEKIIDYIYTQKNSRVINHKLYELLKYLERNNGPNITKIISNIKINHTHISRLIKELEKEEIIEIERIGVNKKIFLIDKKWRLRFPYITTNQYYSPSYKNKRVLFNHRLN